MQLCLSTSTCQSYVRDSIFKVCGKDLLASECEAMATRLSNALAAGTSPRHGAYNIRVAEEHNDGNLYYCEFDPSTARSRYIRVDNPIKKTYCDYKGVFFDLYRRSRSEAEYSQWISATMRNQIQIDEIYFAALLTLIEVFFDSEYEPQIFRDDAELERSFIADMLIAITLATLAAASFRDDNKHSYLAALQTLWRHARPEDNIVFTTHQFAEWQTEKPPLYGPDCFWTSPGGPGDYDTEHLLEILRHHQLIERTKNGWLAVHLLYLQDTCGEIML